MKETDYTLMKFYRRLPGDDEITEEDIDPENFDIHNWLVLETRRMLQKDMEEYYNEKI